MKVALKVVLSILALVVVVLGGFVGYLAVKPPKRRPPAAEKIEATPARLARGEYLTHHVTDCLGCHSDHLLTYGFPVKPGTEGQGGFPFDEKFGVPGVVCAQNITPDPDYGLGRWSDGEVMRAVREGIDRNGNALFPMMPYDGYRNLSDEDTRAIIVFLRTLPAAHRSVPPKHIRFPVNLFVKSAPQPLDGPVTAPDDSRDHLGYGRYLTTIAGCQGCHTTVDAHHAPIAGMEFAGGAEFDGPWGRVRAANITPEEHTWMGNATKDEFLGRFRAFVTLAAATAPPAGQNTIMPWLSFAGMTDQDLSAVYDYLKTVKPIAHSVVSFPDARK